MHLWVVIQHEELQVEYWVEMTDPCRVDCRSLTVICTVYSHKLACCSLRVLRVCGMRAMTFFWVGYVL